MLTTPEMCLTGRYYKKIRTSYPQVVRSTGRHNEFDWTSQQPRLDVTTGLTGRHNSRDWTSQQHKYIKNSKLKLCDFSFSCQIKRISLDQKISKRGFF